MQESKVWASSSAGDNSQSDSSSAVVCVESTAQWQVHSIGLDAQEKYIEPETLHSYVGRVSHTLPWPQLVHGADAAAAQLDSDEEGSTEPDEPQLKRAKLEDDESKVAEAGGGEQTRPHAFWTDVAKKLQSSLLQLDILSDVVRVANAGNYLRLQPAIANAHPGAEQEDATRGTKVTENRHFALAAKRRAFSSASETVRQSARALRLDAACDASHKFLTELRALRLDYRLRKVHNKLYGDLAYQPQGARFSPRHTFEVSMARRSGDPTDTSSTADGRGGDAQLQPALAVNLPAQLRTPCRLEISLVKDTSAGLVDGASSSQGAESAGGAPPADDCSDDWRAVLSRARASLVARDMFAQLCGELAASTDMSAMCTGDTLVAALPVPGDFALHVRLLQSASGDESASAGATAAAPLLKTEMGEPAATGTGTADVQCADDWHRAHLGRVAQWAFARNISAPNWSLGPMLAAMSLAPHATHQRRLAGCTAVPKALLSSSGGGADHHGGLLSTLVCAASSVVVCERVQSVLVRWAAGVPLAPDLFSVKWRWVRLENAGGSAQTDTVSLLKITLATRHYEAFCRSSLLLEVRTGRRHSALRMVTPDGKATHLSHADKHLESALATQACRHLLHAVSTLARCMGWHASHLDIGASSAAVPAPSILLTNHSGSRKVRISLPLNLQPSICVLRLQYGAPSRSDCTTRQLAVPFDRMPGRGLMHKVELLLASLSCA